MTPAARAGAAPPLHPVKRELLRLLGGVALCALLVLGAYLFLEHQLDRLRLAQARFHTPALEMSTELGAVLASMTAPQGLSAGAVERLDDEVAFVSGVTRDFGRAQAILAALIALHEQVPDPAFERTAWRLARAEGELATIERDHRGDPLAMARLLSLRPLYAAVVAQQTQRLHEEASRSLQQRRAQAQQRFVGVFVFVCAALGLGLALQLRRSLRGIDGILQQERDARDGVAAVLAAVPDLWFVLDEQGRFAEVSDPGHPHLAPAWPALRGQPFTLVPAPADTPGQVLGTDPAQRHARSLEYAAAADAQGPRAFEARLVPTGNRRWLYLSRDISERKRAEIAMARSHEELERQVASRTAQLTIARDAAEEANRAKSEFLSRMSHELRTPMNAVLGFAQLLGLDPATSHKQRQSLDHILRAGKHLLHLINDVLDLAQVESGRMTLSPEPLGVEDIVQEVAALMRPLARDHRVQVEVAPMRGSVVRGDRLRVKQVLLNLTANAIKYNRPGGWVRLQAHADDDQRVRIDVEDSGQGITPQGLSKLFEPFSRLGAERDGIEGTGIGLSISKRLVELMDGRIGVDSEAGRGSRFWIELPSDRLAAPPPPRHSAFAELSPAAQERPAVLLYVEDNPDNMALVARVVERHARLTLITAPTAALGLDLARSHRPDLILLDIHLPDGTGYGLLERLRAHDATRAIPAVALTANAMPHEEARAMAAGFAAYLAKPVDVHKLDAMLRRLLGRG